VKLFLAEIKEEDPMSSEQALGFVRHVLTFVAGIAVSKGYIDSETALAISGGIVAAFGAVWSWRSKTVKP
jgi:hypothetical protein